MDLPNVTIKYNPPLADPLDRPGRVDDEDKTTLASEPDPIDQYVPRIASSRPTTPDHRISTPSEAGDLEENVGPDDSASQTGIYRAELFEKYQQCLIERDKMLKLNAQYQHKIALYFRTKKGVDERQEVYQKSVSDQEQRYMKCIQALDELEIDNASTRAESESRIMEEKERLQEKKELVDDTTNQYFEFQKEAAKSSFNSRSGKRLPQRYIDHYVQNEQKKETEVISVRLGNIKLKNKLTKRKMSLEQKEELPDGLHLVDLVQLIKDKQANSEKLEDRNERLLKFRKKITSNVQVLTHVKEKVQFVQGQNTVQGEKLKVVESEVAKKRDILSRTKQARDALRIDNLKLRNKCGLIGQEALLRDFEVRKDDADSLTDCIDQLQARHMDLLMQIDGVRQKVDATEMHDM